MKSFELSDKAKILLSALALALAFATGRYTVQKPAIKETVHEVQAVDTRVDTNEHKKIIVDEKPGGEKITTITDDTATDEKQASHDDVSADITVTPPKINTLNISALAGVDPLNSFKPVYGTAVTKQILGPVTIGAFGMSNGVVGLSVGISF